ncbi:40S ribosomal protein S9-2 [Platanthera guangdongensis]|uniref:40S ribosomal protein S9-2 n=1 Tax=Platanthera guangdongensis TaxID=2320717 RepID=A0ABR2LHB1_9ASPA
MRRVILCGENWMWRRQIGRCGCHDRSLGSHQAPEEGEHLNMMLFHTGDSSRKGDIWRGDGLFLPRRVDKGASRAAKQQPTPRSHPRTGRLSDARPCRGRGRPDVGRPYLRRPVEAESARAPGGPKRQATPRRPRSPDARAADQAATGPAEAGLAAGRGRGSLCAPGDQTPAGLAEAGRGRGRWALGGRHRAVEEATTTVNGKTFKKPRRPYEKERLDAELKLVGEYGLRCKRELWRVQYVLSRIRNAARELLTLDEKNPKRIFEGEALLRRTSVGCGLGQRWEQETGWKREAVRGIGWGGLTGEEEGGGEGSDGDGSAGRKRLTVASGGEEEKAGFRQIAVMEVDGTVGGGEGSGNRSPVGRQVVNIPSFMVRVDSAKHIDFSLTSPFGGGRPGRVKRRNQKAAAKKAAGGAGDGDEDDED